MSKRKAVKFSDLAKKYRDNPELLKIEKNPAKKLINSKILKNDKNKAGPSSTTNKKKEHLEKDIDLKSSICTSNQSSNNQKDNISDDFGFVISTKPTSLVEEIPLPLSGGFTIDDEEWFKEELYPFDLSPHARLHSEINTFINFLGPKRSEIRLWEFLCDSIETCASKLWPSSSVKLYGSYTEGLLLPSSDINVNITLPGQQNSKEDLLSVLAENLKECLDLSDPYFFSHVGEKSLNLVEANSKMVISITLNANRLTESSDFIISQLEKYPVARIIISIVKYLVNFQVGDVGNKRISSFATNLLVISFFQ